MDSTHDSEAVRRDDARAPRRDRRRRPAGHRARRRAARAPACRVDGPLGRGADARRATLDAVLLCVPDAQIATAAAAVATARRPARRPLLGRDDARPLAGHEAFSLHPLMTVPEPAARASRAPTAAIAGATPRALAAAEELADRARDAPRPRRRRGSRRLPRGRLHRLELPRHARGRRRAPRRDRGIDREPLVALVRASVENWAAAGARRRPDRPDRPRRRADRRAPARRRRRARARGPRALRRARRRDPPPRRPTRTALSGARPARTAHTRATLPAACPRPSRRVIGHEDASHRRRAARRSSPRTPRRHAASASCRRWAPCTTATSR